MVVIMKAIKRLINAVINRGSEGTSAILMNATATLLLIAAFIGCHFAVVHLGDSIIDYYLDEWQLLFMSSFFVEVLVVDLFMTPFYYQILGKFFPNYIKRIFPQLKN